MKMCGRIWSVSLVLILAVLTLAGCGRRAIRDRSDASATEAITIEMQAPQPQNTAPQQDPSALAESMAESAAQTPTQMAQQPSADATDAELMKLMDELQTALDELDETITKTDLDALTDASLAALGK